MLVVQNSLGIVKVLFRYNFLICSAGEDGWGSLTKKHPGKEPDAFVRWQRLCREYCIEQKESNVYVFL